MVCRFYLAKNFFSDDGFFIKNNPNLYLFASLSVDIMREE